MATTELSIAVVPVDLVDPCCRRARLLTAMTLGGRISILCQGVFELLFEYLGISSRQFTVQHGISPVGYTTASLLVDFKGPRDPRWARFVPSTENFYHFIPGLGDFHMYISSGSRYGILHKGETAVVDLGCGLAVAARTFPKGRVDLLSDPAELLPDQMRLLAVLEAGLIIAQGCTSTTRPTWNEDQVSPLAGRGWVRVGLFDAATTDTVRVVTPDSFCPAELLARLRML